MKPSNGQEYLHDCTHSYLYVIVSKKDENATDDTPSAANMPSTIAACIGSDNVLTPDNDGKAHPSSPTPAIAVGSGSTSSTFLLKKDRDVDGVQVEGYLCNLV